MPFTPSHAVIALPFLRSPLLPAAIAVGAMAPDLPLFLRGVGLDYGRTHDFAWIPMTMVVALVLLIIWRSILRPAVRELSPKWLAARLPREWDRGAVPGVIETFALTGTPGRASWRGVLLLVVSLALGVASHIVWDLFTHEGRWGSEVLPVLDESWGPVNGYTWLQHGSSVVGLAIIAVWAAVWLRRADAAARVDRVLPAWIRRTWWVSLPVVLLGTWVWGMAAFGPFTPEWTIPHLAYRVLPPACAAWGCATLILCVVVQIARTIRERSAAVIGPG